MIILMFERLGLFVHFCCVFLIVSVFYFLLHFHLIWIICVHDHFCLYFDFIDSEHVWLGTEALAHRVHAPADPGVGEGIPLQSLPDPEKKDRNRQHTVSKREADKDLVPEPQDEVEERPPVTQHQSPIFIFIFLLILV